MVYHSIAVFACLSCLAQPATAQRADIAGKWDVAIVGDQGPQAAPAQAEAKLDVTGTWAFAVETAAGSGTPTIVLKQEGATLTGTYTGQLGEAPLTGTLKGTAIEFTIDLSVQGTAVHIVYAGTADNSSMKGTVKLGDFGDGTFTAKKTK